MQLKGKKNSQKTNKLRFKSTLKKAKNILKQILHQFLKSTLLPSHEEYSTHKINGKYNPFII